MINQNPTKLEIREEACNRLINRHRKEFSEIVKKIQREIRRHGGITR